MADTRDGVRAFEFTNQYGERWTLLVRLGTEIGELSGDDLEDSCVTIRNDELAADLILGDDEAAWLNQCWQTALGRRLRSSGLQRLIETFSQLKVSGGDRPSQIRL